MTDKYLEKNTVISGIGQSEIGRRLPQSGLRLTLDAAQSAMQDAGLTAADIDGIATWPGVMEDSQPGFSPVSIPDIQNALGLNLNWYKRSRRARIYSNVSLDQRLHGGCLRPSEACTLL